MGPALSEITVSWRIVSVTRFQGGGYHGWGAMYAPGKLRIKEGRLSYSRCPERLVRFTYTPDFVLRREDAAPSAGAGGCRGVSPALTEVEQMLTELLEQSPEAERVPGGRLILRSPVYAVVLTSEDDYQREFGRDAAEWEKRPGG
jgi:hypothetical protein